MDALLDAAEATLTVGVRELACRLNRGSHNFGTAIPRSRAYGFSHLSNHSYATFRTSGGKSCLQSG